LILGDGVVGREVAAELARRGISSKLGSRRTVNDDTHVQVNAGDAQSVTAASRGASHIYITLGLPYVAKIWEAEWPLIMRSVIEAARVNGARVVYFDNIYAYGPPPLQNPITEEHPVGAVSRKGKARQAIAAELLTADEAGTVKALIARAADYYGPGATNSGLYVMALSRMLAGKAPQLLSDPGILHSYTYTLDAARGLVELALDEGAYGQVWHLPTAAPTLRDSEILAKLAELTGTHGKPMVMPRALLPVLGVFVPILKDVREMLYQTDSDYVFSSAKFAARYPQFRVTPYDEGLQVMVESFRA
jgi:nucleoside-diphosphate-sugar epimerase